MIVTIDGPSGTGKSTVARLVAEKLHFSYFDTGAMYRALSWFLLKKKIDISNPQAIEKVLKEFSFILKDDGGKRRYFVGNEEVTEEIRQKHVTDVVSQISAYKIVRDLLSATQKQYGAKGKAVFEGRDLGTVIFPHAEVKIFLTARPEVRAQRRHKELMAKNPKDTISEDTVLEAIKKRDEYDSTREIAPLSCPKDAFVVDTSDLSVEEVVDKILDYTYLKYPI